MDNLITAIRIPFGLLALLVQVAFWLLILLIESMAALGTLVYLALSSKRDDAKVSWVRQFPASIRAAGQACAKVGHWVFADDTQDPKDEVPASALVVCSVVVAVLMMGGLWYWSYRAARAARHPRRTDSLPPPGRASSKDPCENPRGLSFGSSARFLRGNHRVRRGLSR